LTESDVMQLERAGFGRKEFTVEVEGEARLANVHGVCYFLKSGMCGVYDLRPEGCKLYPVVYDERIHKFILDLVCPHRAEFRIASEYKERLKKLLHRINRETDQRHK